MAAVGRARQVRDLRFLERSFHGTPARIGIATSERGTEHLQLPNIYCSRRSGLVAQTSEAVAMVHLRARPVLADPSLKALRNRADALGIEFRRQHDRSQRSERRSLSTRKT